MAETKAKQESHGHMIGHAVHGGLEVHNGKVYARKANIHRFNGGALHGEIWGRPDGGYTQNDLAELGYAAELIPSHEETSALTTQVLQKHREGHIPQDQTLGAEREGAVYTPDGTTLINAHDDPNTYDHPELLGPILETATAKLITGNYARTAVEVAESIGAASAEAIELASARGGVVVDTSVPESGSFDQVALTRHGYLLSFAPKVLNEVLKNAHNIPPEVRVLYSRIGIPDIEDYLTQTGILNWPVHALHVHSGVPQVEGLANPRLALAMGALRLTEFAKYVSMLLSSTRHCYGVDTGLGADVRSVMRRLLPTSHDTTIPNSFETLFEDAVAQLSDGSIHSLDRYPSHGQHGELRLRMSADKKTVESIGAPMNPDIRLVLMWAYFNQIMDVIGQDALQRVGGDESKVLHELQFRYGELFNVLPAIGPGSAYQKDLEFNSSGFSTNMINKLAMIRHTISYYAALYPSIRTQATIVDKMIGQALMPIDEYGNIESFMGTENGIYRPNGRNRGIITAYKYGVSPSELAVAQAQGTRLQVKALQQVRDEKDLIAFFG